MFLGRGEGRGKSLERPMGRLFRLKVSESLRCFRPAAELVAGAADGDDQALSAELAAQVRHVCICGPLVRDVRARPEVLEDLPSRDDVAGALREQRQKAELR